MNRTATCNHGNDFLECKICYKRPHECDHGTCCRKATVKTVNALGETRPACAKHAKYMGRVAA